MVYFVNFCNMTHHLGLCYLVFTCFLDFQNIFLLLLELPGRGVEVPGLPKLLGALFCAFLKKGGVVGLPKLEIFDFF